MDAHSRENEDVAYATALGARVSQAKLFLVYMKVRMPYESETEQKKKIIPAGLLDRKRQKKIPFLFIVAIISKPWDGGCLVLEADG